MLNLTDRNYTVELSKAAVPVLVIFKASFCGPSALLDPWIDQIIEDFDGRVVVAEIDVEECPKMTREMQVKGTPTAIIFNLGVPLASRIGISEKETYEALTGWIEEYICK